MLACISVTTIKAPRFTMPNDGKAVPRGYRDVRADGPPRRRSRRDEAKVSTETKKQARTGLDREGKHKKHVRDRSEHGRVSTGSEHGRVSTEHLRGPIGLTSHSGLDMSLEEVIQSSPKAPPSDGKGGDVVKRSRRKRLGAKAVADAARQAAPWEGGRGRARSRGESAGGG